jgi:hypothetical protein
MGIYSDGNVYGVSWELRDDDYKLILRYEKIYLKKLTLEQMKEIQEEFEKCSEEQRAACSIQYYTSVTDTYGSDGSYMTWFPGNRQSLEQLFEKGDIPI